MELLEVRSALIDAIEKDCFFKTLDDFEFKEIHVAESVIIEALVNLHNEFILDLNEQYLKLTRSEERQDFYSLIFIYCSALPKLHCSVIDVVNVFIHLKNEDIPDADFAQAYFLFCKQNIERPKVALNYLLEKPEERHELVQSTLMAAVEFDSQWVMEQFPAFIKHQSADIRWQAYLAIGRVLLTDDDMPVARLKLLEEAFSEETDSSAQSGVLRAAGFLAKQMPLLWPQVDCLLKKKIKRVRVKLRE